MGKLKGFLEFKRETAQSRPVAERLQDYREVAGLLPFEKMAAQAARCVDCGIPFCHAMGCPLYNLIPEWNENVFRGDWDEALRRLEMTNNFPEITGRICPAPCESACTLAINDSPVTIKQNELAIIEHAFMRTSVRPQPPAGKSGRRVAVIGSGPAGLAAAQQLARMGHAVVIVEKSKNIGGLLRYGIPNFKLEKWVIDRRLDQLRGEGVVFETEVDAGKDVSGHYLRRTFDAILVACGAEGPRDLDVPGRELEGICLAMEYLSRANRHSAGECTAEMIISARGKNVLVIGGGDTGADCVGTANRQGAANVYQLEIMPKPLIWNETWNPEWPHWPRILRTSSSHEEGGQRDWSVTTQRFEGKNGKVISARCARVAWKNDDGRQVPVVIPGSEFSLDVDLVLLALGFTGIAQGLLVRDLNVHMTAANTIVINEAYMTSVPGVFAAGDAVMGPSLVVRSIFQGREAARGIHQYLSMLR